MPNKNFYFPSKTGHYKTDAGELRFRIYYEDSTESDTDMHLEIYQMDKLRIQIAENKTSGKRELTQFGLTFSNDDNILFTYGVISEASQENTYFQIIRDGSVFWDGKLDWGNHKYKDWDGNIYREVYFRFLDRIIDLKKHTLLDYFGYGGEDIQLTTLINNIASVAGLTANFPGNFSIEEFEGYEKTIYDFKIREVPHNISLIEVLKLLSKSLAMDFYNLNGNLYFVERDGLNIESLTNLDLSQFEKIQECGRTKFLNIIAQHDWEMLAVIDHGTSYGDESENDYENLELDLSQILGKIFCNAPSIGSTLQPNPKEPVAEFENFYVEYDPSSQVNFNDIAFGEWIETGMRFHADNGISETYRSYVKKVLSSISFEVLDVSSIFPTYPINDDSYVDRQNDSRLYKTELLAAFIGNMHYRYYILGESFKSILFGIKSLGIQYSYQGYNYTIRKAEFDLINGLTYFDLVKMPNI